MPFLLSLAQSVSPIQISIFPISIPIHTHLKTDVDPTPAPSCGDDLKGVFNGLAIPKERDPLLVGDSGDPGDIASTDLRLCRSGRRRRFLRMWLARGVLGWSGDLIGSPGCCSCIVHATRRMGM